MDHPNWYAVEPIVIAFPLSVLVALIVALITRPPADEHLRKCFGSGTTRPAATAGSR
jgi:SSS family solute:Na+ symporter